ncbi:MAG: hypothetical protein AAF456_13465 [Planctomycetota bacterium]
MFQTKHASPGEHMTVPGGYKEARPAMFLYQLILFIGGVAVTLMAITATQPVRKDNPITGC